MKQILQLNDWGVLLDNFNTLIFSQERLLPANTKLLCWSHGQACMGMGKRIGDNIGQAIGVNYMDWLVIGTKGGKERLVERG